MIFIVGKKVFDFVGKDGNKVCFTRFFYNEAFNDCSGVGCSTGYFNVSNSRDDVTLPDVGDTCRVYFKQNSSVVDSIFIVDSELV